MAKVGNHRSAQAYAKNWGRKMKKQGVTTEQKKVRGHFIDNFKELYSGIGQQDEKEQVEQNAEQQYVLQPPKGKAKGLRRSSAESYESDSESEGHDEERISTSKKSGFFGGITNFFGSGKSKSKKTKKKQSFNNMDSKSNMYANYGSEDDDVVESMPKAMASIPASIPKSTHSRGKLSDSLSANLYKASNKSSKMSWN